MSSTQRNLKDGSNNDVAVRNYLQALLGDKITRDYPVVDFVEAVWGLSRAKLLSRGSRYTLNITAAQKYIQRKYNKNISVQVERSAYAPLVEIFEDIIKQVLRNMGKDDHGTKSQIVNMRDRVVQGHFANFKPDFIWSWLANGSTQSWLLTALCGELKKSNTQEFRPRVGIDLERLPEVCKQFWSQKTHDSHSHSTCANSPPMATEILWVMISPMSLACLRRFLTSTFPLVPR